MPNNFSLASLVPEGPTFTDDGKGGDGQTYDVSLPADFDSYQYARMAELQEELPDRLLQIAALKEKGPEAAKAALALDQTVNDFFQLLIPDLPEARVKAIKLGHKLEFIKWWRQQVQQPKAADQQQAAARVGEVTGRAKTRRGKRSPDSSASTA